MCRHSNLFLFSLPDSYYQVNLDMELREAILEAIEQGRVTPELFDDAETHVLGLLRYCVFPLFKATPEFNKVLKETNCADLQELILRKRKTSSTEEMGVEDTHPLAGTGVA